MQDRLSQVAQTSSGDLGTDQAMNYEEVIQRNFGVYSHEQQTRIRDSHVAIVGIGCDGGLAASILARVGIGFLTVIDFDTYEPSNLNRQPLATVSNVGQKKALSAIEVLHEFNPFVTVSAIDCDIAEVSDDKIAGAAVILQCVDNFPARVAIHRLGRRLGIPVVSMTGQPPFKAFVSTFFPDGPDYEEVMGLPSLRRPLTPDVRQQLERLKDERAEHASYCGATPGWKEAYLEAQPGWGGQAVGWGITAERAYITATLQAHEALRVITGREVLGRAPSAILIDLDETSSIVQVRQPQNGKSWRYQEF